MTNTTHTADVSGMAAGHRRHGVDERRSAITRDRDRRLARERRRRILGIASVVFVLALAAIANWGPYQEYQAAQQRLTEAELQVGRLRADVQEARARVDLLRKDGYVEALAREEFTYARPGEEVFIVTGFESTGGAMARGPDDAGSGSVRGRTADAAPGVADAAPGPAESVVRFLRNLF